MTEYATKQDLDVGLQSVRDEIRSVGVVVERIDSKVGALAEALVATRDELKRDIAEVERSLSARISILEEVVRQNSRDIRALQADVHALQVDVRALQVEVAELRAQFESRDRNVEELERRVTALEVRIAKRRR